MMGEDTLSIWTVYDHPTDFPEHYVARLFLIDRRGTKTTAQVMASPSLESLRHVLRTHGLIQLERDPADDAKIVEVWL